MTALNKQALREAAERAASDSWGYDRDEFNEFLTPATVLALLDEPEAKDKRIAELEAREINLPPYSFFDFKQGSPFKSGAYCHIDSVNQELSKHGIKMTAAAGKGE
ncbi:hypothetical protein L423_03206 [Enterobacter roggenkampii]|uniref:ead/Ea22-like family protein n=1 Tax=Enterobacter roggenkampii TaxID=1812935 RepID=UPI0003BFA9FF|nr:ead/Ea22-like family protein [Enterobacter roggenkampii]ESL75529.1 hypothetical protein L423_03206 [Enterobacter roggenkampii]